MCLRQAQWVGDIWLQTYYGHACAWHGDLPAGAPVQRGGGRIIGEDPGQTEGKWLELSGLEVPECGEEWHRAVPQQLGAGPA